MKMYKPIKYVALSLTAIPALFSAQGAFAAAGDNIVNNATIDYTVGSTNLSENASTTFVEDRLLNFTVTREDTTYVDVSPDQSDDNVILTFLVTNTGNGTQDFSLSQVLTATDPFGGTESFDANVVGVFVDSEGYTTDDSAATSGFDSSVDTATFVDELGSGETATVYIQAQIPDGSTVSDGDISSHSLVAQVAVGGGAGQGADITSDDSGAADDPSTEQVVFGDAAGPEDAATDGLGSDNGSFRVQTASIVVSKVTDDSLNSPDNDGGVLWDPINASTNAKSIPGAYVRYVVRVENNGTGSATLTTISDVLPAQLSFDTELMAAGCADAAPTGPDSCPAVAGGTVGAGNGVSIRVVYNNDGSGDERATTTFDVSAANPSIDLSTVLPAEGNYVAGELKPNESVDIMYNAIVQ